MQLQEFFEPIDFRQFDPTEFEEASWYSVFNSPHYAANLIGKKIALIGIQEPDNPSDSTANEIRKHLYRLKRTDLAEKVIDMGNFIFHYKQKSYEHLGYILSELMQQEIVPIILNGRQEISYAQYLGFKYLKKYVNVCSIDSRLDFHLREDEEINSGSYLQKMLMEDPSYLFHFSNIGYQSHFADPDMSGFLSNLYFELYRLSEVRENLHDMEPVLRNSSMLSVDMSAIKHSDAPEAYKTGPNGLTGEEICQLMRYAGTSNKMQSVGIYDFLRSEGRITAHQVAQMVWYFADGYFSRRQESPAENKDDFLKFITTFQNNAYQITFYKSKLTDRWWMEVPVNEYMMRGENYIIPCSYNDYLQSTKDDVPDRWWQALQKLG